MSNKKFTLKKGLPLKKFRFSKTTKRILMSGKKMLQKMSEANKNPSWKQKQFTK